MLEKILGKHGQRHGDVLLPLAETFRPMHEELDGHLMKEEMILFPLIRQLDTAGVSGPGFHCGSLRNPIRVMTMEHDNAGEALARLRELTAGYTPPDDACNTFRAFYAELADLERDLHRHIHLENNILFPRAVEREAMPARSRGTAAPFSDNRVQFELQCGGQAKEFPMKALFPTFVAACRARGRYRCGVRPTESPAESAGAIRPREAHARLVARSSRRRPAVPDQRQEDAPDFRQGQPL